MQPGDKDDGPRPDAVAILDAVIEHVAQEEAENGEPTEQDIQWSRDLRRQVQARIAELRRQLNSVKPLRALDRAELLARLKALPGDGARHDLASLSDEELRQMISHLTGPTEGGT
jgi:hypothetical protein